jgi:hypothetical protein
MSGIRPLFVLVASLLMAGCAKQPPGPPPEAPLPRYNSVAQLSEASLDQRARDRTAGFHITGVTTGAGAQTMSGDGEMIVDANGLSLRFTQQIQHPGGSPGPQITMVILPGQAYLQVPQSSAKLLPPGRTWFRIQDDASSPAMQQFAQAVRSLRANADPIQGFSQWGSAVRIVNAEPEMFDNSPAMRYQISIDLAAAAELTTDPAQRRTLNQLVLAGARTDDTTLWLNRQNRQLRMVLTRNLLDNEGKRATYTLTTRYRDWGEQVQISAPPPDQVVGN